MSSDLVTSGEDLPAGLKIGPADTAANNGQSSKPLDPIERIMSAPTHYKVLGVESTATTEEIVKAYRKCALKAHPDKNLGNRRAADAFRALELAKETLTTTHHRRLYDVMLLMHQGKYRPDMDSENWTANEDGEEVNAALEP